MAGGIARQAVAAVVRRGDEVLLVRQQGPDDPEAAWALPGGVVEHDELLVAALVRELREETGLVAVRLDRLLYVTQVQIPNGRWAGGWTSFVFAVEADGEIGCADPDGYVLEARWIAVPKAIALLDQQPFAPMREPVVAYLDGRATVPTMWVWTDIQDRPQVIPPLDDPFLLDGPDLADGDVMNDARR